MKRQRAPNGKTPIESSLSDLILKPGSEKIRRPPNAFMIFAREHRKVLSKQHPDVSNKAISTMLGNIWRNSSNNTKVKYYEQASMLADLHKRRYPDYVYSPREARLQKMIKKKKKDVIINDTSVTKEDLAAVMKNEENTNNSKEEDWESDIRNHTDISPGYLPNNPEYLIHASPEVFNETDGDLSHCMEYQTDNQQGGETGEMPMDMDQERIHRTEGSRFSEPVGDSGCSRSRLGSKDRGNTPCEMRERFSPFFPPEHLHCPHARLPTFYNSSRHMFPESRTPFYYGPPPCSSPIPPTYGPSYHPYWSPPMMNPHYAQDRDYMYDDLKPFSYPVQYRPSEFCRPPYGYFDSTVAPECRSPSFSLHPQFNDGYEGQRSGQNEFVTEYSEPHLRSSRSGEKEHLTNPHPSSSRKDVSCFQNRIVLKSDEQNIGYLPSFTKTEAQQQALSQTNSYIRHNGNPINSPSKITNNCEWNKKPYPVPSVPEGKLKDASAFKDAADNHYKYFNCNRNIRKEENTYDSNNKKRQSQFENATLSFLSPDIENMRENVKSHTSEYVLRNKFQSSECDDSFKTSDSKMETPTNFCQTESIGLHFKNSTGINSSFISKNGFQRMNKGFLELPIGALNENTVEYINKLPEAINEPNEFDFVSQKESVLKNNDENQYQTLESSCNFDEMALQTPIRNCTTFLPKNSPHIQNNLCNISVMTNSNKFPLAGLKAETCNQASTMMINSRQFSTSEIETKISQDTNLTREMTRCKNTTRTSDKEDSESTDLYKTIIQTDKTLTSAKTYQPESELSSDNRNNVIANSEDYSNDIAINFSSKDLVESMVSYQNNDNLILMKQQGVPKIYYERNDGSYVPQDKLPGFNALPPNDPSRTISCNNLDFNSENVTSSKPLVVKVEPIENFAN